MGFVGHPVKPTYQKESGAIATMTIIMWPATPNKIAMDAGNVVGCVHCEYVFEIVPNT